MKKYFACVVLLISINAASQKKLQFTKAELKDKIMGGWAGQTIGVTFGGPYEFRFSGSFIQDYQPLIWYDGYIKKTMLEIPGLYDDLYMDLTFVDVFERYGLDAPVDSFANAFANAEYMLWHANQAARYNILNGIKAPMSGHWKNNPHADDIDYQIEADFAGLMSPGMPNTASAISDKIGHIMNYGDGWYGGVFMGAMYSLAFTSDKIHYIISEALKTIPGNTKFHRCISDVITWHKQHPSDWHQTWLQIQKKWSSDIACPEGVFAPFDIDATINSAYVVLGLLYGNGDFSKTMEITTRAGQDADCNPSSAGGILGTVLGYKKIPVHWKMGLTEAEDIPFKYTNISLNKVYEIGFRHALEIIKRNGGNVDGDKATILVQTCRPVKYEQSFEGLYPVEKKGFYNRNFKELNFEFEGTGFALKGEARKMNKDNNEHVFEAELFIDGEKIETARFPANFTTRRHELFWKYLLPNGRHQVKVRVLNPKENFEINTTDYIIYNNQPSDR
ncbi:MAG: ADP-ribosylglycohydrolase family protein [Chitinophagaceae bacterium]|nr:ADP-ribosylglycohydrolase family protein [Chitinophagaceae bacterium]